MTKMIHVCLPGDQCVEVPEITEDEEDVFFEYIIDYFYRQSGYLAKCRYCEQLFPFFPFGIRYSACLNADCEEKDIAQGEICKAEAANKEREAKAEQEERKREREAAKAEREASRLKSNGGYEGYVYLFSDGEGMYKIGITSTGVERRLKDIQNMSPKKIDYIHHFLSRDYFKTEKRLHERYDQFREHGEWFRLPQEAVEMIMAMKDYSRD